VGTNVGIKNSNRGGLTSAGGTNVDKYLGQMIGTVLLATNWSSSKLPTMLATIYRVANDVILFRVANDVIRDKVYCFRVANDANDVLKRFIWVSRITYYK
jgi:hypothetical protein